MDRATSCRPAWQFVSAVVIKVREAQQRLASLLSHANIASVKLERLNDRIDAAILADFYFVGVIHSEVQQRRASFLLHTRIVSVQRHCPDQGAEATLLAHFHFVVGIRSEVLQRPASSSVFVLLYS